MAGRVKADCWANLIEHSCALTHLIPIGLRVIGYHLGSAHEPGGGTSARLAAMRLVVSLSAERPPSGGRGRSPGAGVLILELV
jgi:hypothetical protein